MPVTAARRALDLPTVGLVHVVLASHRAHDLHLAEGRVHHGTTPLPAVVDQAVTEIRARLTEDPFNAPTANQLAELGLDARKLGAAVHRGLLDKIADGIYLLPGSDDQ